LISSKLLFPEVKDNSHFIDFFVSSIEFDSRSVKEGSVYFALDGTNENGSIYIDEAIRKGAKLIFTENIIEKKGIIQVPELREYLGVVASRFYDNPTLNLHTFCVTGTNVKTSCVESLSKLLNYY
jgi:UDP-N-acetylmuramoyl-L-alanyl-D-glutamate--2,6-diaminopimelate ligase